MPHVDDLQFSSKLQGSQMEGRLLLPPLEPKAKVEELSGHEIILVLKWPSQQMGLLPKP